MAPSKDPDEREVLQQVLAGFGVLDQNARLRILRTVATYYDLDVPAGASAAHRTSPVTPTREPVFSGHPSMSPKEFLFQKDPQTDVERVACLAYYLSHYREQEHFKTADLSKLNTEAAQRKFANAAYAVNNASHSGFLAAAHGGNKQLTALGEQYVAALPDREAARAVLERVRARRSRDRASRKAGHKRAST